MSKPSVEQINALLPQTQCQLCEFDGCKPYAEAMANGEVPFNRCQPGGIPVLRELGLLLGQDISDYLADFQSKAPTRVIIDEATCIGCTKCIDACPTDAILGSGKKMHTVITDACTGCELCLPPCPVDCIDILPTTDITPEQSVMWRRRHEAKKSRVARLQTEDNQRYRQKLKPDLDERKQAMAAAMARMQKKKST